MRKILFRGLSVNGEWFYGLLSHTENKTLCGATGWFISNGQGAPFAYQVRPETVGQFTGLIDKNGKEIYEGDILNSGTPYASNWLCKFEDGFFGFEKQSYPEKGLYGFRPENIIIGNIYENPQLWGYIADSECLSENDKHGVDVNTDKMMGG